MAKVGYVYDDLMLLHQATYDHEECPDRIVIIKKKLESLGYLEKMVKIPSHYITKEELLLAHDNKFIEKLEKVFLTPEKNIQAHFEKYNSMYANKSSLTSAKIAAGSSLNLFKSILNGEIQHGVGIVRPPGHHCSKTACSGFCMFNNIAICARYGLGMEKRVAVVDFDIHHFDGTANILKHNTNVLAISIHRYDYGKFYPGTGKAMDTYNLLSIPINGTAYDEDYYMIFNEQVIPKIAKFNPDIILVSAGFDAAEGDPLGGFHLTPTCYYNMTRMLLSFGKPVMLNLEGGYNLTSISNSMAECTRALLEDVKIV